MRTHAIAAVLAGLVFAGIAIEPSVAQTPSTHHHSFSGPVASRQTVAPHPALFQVRGRDLEHVALPRAGRKALPRVLGVRRRMRSAVHVDRALLQRPHHRDVPRDHVLGHRVHGTADAQVRRTARRVIRRVRLALAFGHGPFGRIPGIRAQPRRVVDRQTRVVADVGPGTALRQVLVESLAPHAGEIALRVRRRAYCRKRTKSGRLDCESQPPGRIVHRITSTGALPRAHLASGSGRI